MEVKWIRNLNNSTNKVWLLCSCFMCLFLSHALECPSAQKLKNSITNFNQMINKINSFCSTEYLNNLLLESYITLPNRPWLWTLWFYEFTIWTSIMIKSWSHSLIVDIHIPPKESQNANICCYLVNFFFFVFFFFQRSSSSSFSYVEFISLNIFFSQKWKEKEYRKKYL